MNSKDNTLKPEKTIIVDNEPLTLALEGKGPYGEQNSITLSPDGTVILSVGIYPDRKSVMYDSIYDVIKGNVSLDFYGNKDK